MLATWRILDLATVPPNAPTIIFDCPSCTTPATLPVVGRALAQVQRGVVFDPGPYALPRTIQCRHCRRRFTLDEGASRVR